jgi:hypothetical protein
LVPAPKEAAIQEQQRAQAEQQRAEQAESLAQANDNVLNRQSH